MPAKPRLTIATILRWADAHHRRTGKWPGMKSGDIKENPADTWMAINSALRAGIRGLPRYSGIAELLQEHRGVRNRPPPLSIQQILAWADAHHRRTGEWPTQYSGKVKDAPGETWNGIYAASRLGRRGLGRCSLTQILQRYRGKRNRQRPSRLTHKQVLAWADDHHNRTGQWPRHSSGPVRQEPETTWRAVNAALIQGGRGLPGGITLAGLLAERRGVNASSWNQRIKNVRCSIKKRSRPSRLTVGQIVTWADAHHRRTGEWPNRYSGPVCKVPGESWPRIEAALRRGVRGLRGGSSLARVLAKYRGVRNKQALPPLPVQQILTWAKKHRRANHEWPRHNSGPVAGVPGETWSRIHSALRTGSRGLPRGYTLSRFLTDKLGVRNRWSRVRLTVKQILAWADEHKRRTGRWPMSEGGRVTGVKGESWKAINTALYQGLRGLPGGDSLTRLLARRRRKHG